MNSTTLDKRETWKVQVQKLQQFSVSVDWVSEFEFHFALELDTADSYCTKNHPLHDPWQSCDECRGCEWMRTCLE